MDVATSINPNTTTMKIIDISDDDNNVDNAVSIIYSSKRKRTTINDPISVEEYFEKTKKRVLIDLFEDDDDVQILSSKGCLNLSNSSSMMNSIKQFDETFMCEICVDEKATTEKFHIMGCTHSYCKQCTINYIASKLQQNVPRIACPVPGCNGTYEPYNCRSILPKQVFDRWGDVLFESMIMDTDKLYCPNKNCSAPLLIDGNRGRILVNKETKCPECKKLFCASCKVPWHKGILCEEFQKMQKNDEAGREDIMLLKLAKRRRWQRCPKCRIYVARNKGCPHMHCRCGCHFCYKCGAELNANHNCT